MPDEPFLLAQSTVKQVLLSRHAPWVLGVAPLAVVLAARMLPERFSAAAHRRITGVGAALAATFAMLILGVIAANVRAPRDYDYKYFWSWGVAVTEGSNPYDHDNLLRIVRPLGGTEEIEAGLYCYYPPTALLYFAPFGYLPFRGSLLVWSLVQLVALSACLWLLVRQFAPGEGASGATPLVALGLVHWSTAATFAFSQTTFLLLLCVLLFWRNRERPTAGVWAGLAMVVKPIGVLLTFYLLLRLKFRAIAAQAATFLVACALAALVFGPDIFRQFFTQNGVAETARPTEFINQSLSAVLLRAGGADPSALGMISSPWVTAASVAVVLVTAVVVLLARGDRHAYAIGAVLPMMLLVYPGTLTHYGAQLLPSMALLIAESARLQDRPSPARRAGWLMILVASLLLCALRQTFFAILLMWGVMVWEGVRDGLRREEAFEAHSSPG